jgi:hypothetical protein
MKAAVRAEISVPEKCIKQFALNAIKNAKFLLSPLKANRFTAAIALRKKEDINPSA